ncbi:uncharacterized protein TrAFT101_005045 [Trichoderma asperellum]|uniref:Uncharacterized protein n=1 Tax=Trichoderma asperellum (strain ATCC 204424 / CBS 433.97 / NBRC 101777) TaxID=1042311 RepID=A0A2T3Z548_TRIA4|nr:hypothetical protein M441DRAFT_169690 [Trichoderma asperellum CBS 433.97]PTB39917.1 hypothetical protein M441DRAFT_169690 [Trichoderma asperellum CBS 433.97]UKZ90010.1 hypothetical protein TrAFT101_005045 [Trichoderma asperellum]
MRPSYLFHNIAAFSGAANAFWGQMAAEPKHEDEGGVYQWVHLTDYNTGSRYSTQLPGGFDGCASPFACYPVFREDSGGSYNFHSKVWRSADGCHHIDFQGGLDAHEGWCCGSLPCDFSA